MIWPLPMNPHLTPSDAADHSGMSQAGGGRSTVDRAEIAKFEPTGKFRPLHRLNPVRIGFIRDRLARSVGRDPESAEPLRGLSILDIGCGGGLLTEPLARLGATVTGIDAAARNIEIARAHAATMGVKVTYLACSAEDLAAQDGQFDAVLAMEIVEHVADLDSFVTASAGLMKPNGLMFVATLNRTVKSFAMAIVGAEYVLRWLPRGTHDWRRFVRPSELAQRLRASGLTLKELAGVTYSPLEDSFALGRDCAVNYLAVAHRSGVP
jgi:2-polyprenyl-6-hydroxyphenyl methylase/3-demethylubiquinone-9 3-methyltransferase